MGNKGTPQPTKKQQPAYTTRYIAVDSHLTERNGSTESVFGLAGERPAGRKLAQDVANACNQLDSEGYEVISIVPLTSGRIVEATVEAEERVQGRTYSKNVAVDREPLQPLEWISRCTIPLVSSTNKSTMLIPAPATA